MTWRPISRPADWRPSLVIDRVTASRMGITPQMIDETLYDAFGQRQISTLYTQLNQYHVILETMPEFQTNPAKLQDIYVRSAIAPSATATASTSNNSLVTASTASGGSSGGASLALPFRHDVQRNFRVSQSAATLPSTVGGAVERIHAFRIGDRAALRKSPGPISGGHDFV